MTCYRLVQVRWKVFGLLLESRVRLHVIDAPFIPSDLFSTAALTALCLAQPSLWLGTETGCDTRGGSFACSDLDA